MTRLFSPVFPRLIGAALLIAAMSACATKPAASLPPPPPALVAIPPQPRPPLGAQTNLAVPPLDATGRRIMVNAGISAAQTVWNLRSAYNVAALDCLRPEHAAILEGYKIFLKANTKRLAAANRQVDAEFAARAGKGRNAARMREAYMTQVYNFYALPPTLPAFCDATLAMSAAAAKSSPKEIDAFAATNLAMIDAVFQQFYDSYDQYRADLAAWRARYAPSAAPTVPTAGPSPSPTAPTP